MDNDDTQDMGPMDEDTTWGFIALIARYERDMAAQDAANDL